MPRTSKRRAIVCVLSPVNMSFADWVGYNTGGDDLALGNALAVAALNSFQNFKLYREVGCLKDERTQAYCFAEAANATTAR